MPFILVFSSLGANILNGGWHDCRLQISVNELTVIIDEKAIQLTHSTLPAHFGRYVYFGQSPKVFVVILAGTTLSYQGCIRQIFINGLHSQFKDAKRVSFSTPLPSPGCKADKCSDSSTKQCSNNGYCVGNNTGLFCHCNYGYSGPNCENCK